MTRQVVRPEGIDFDSIGRRDYWVALEHDSIWGDHLLPLTVFVGPKATDGEGLVAFGATHGNEYEGPIAIKRLTSEIRSENVKGRLIFIPVLNPAAFGAGTRDSSLHDGVNLNRAFVEGAGVQPALAGITHRIATFVRKYIWPQVHVVLDLHSGGMVARFGLCASFHPLGDSQQSKLTEEAARWFGTPFLMIYQNTTPGLLTSEAERLGKITVGTELGWGAAVQAAGVRYGRHGVLANAIHHGQLSGEIEPIGYHKSGKQRKIEIVEYECYSVAPFAGHYEPFFDCGAPVKCGETVGLLHDFDRIDLDPCPIVSGVDGILVAQAWKADVLAGQHIAVVGREI